MGTGTLGFSRRGILDFRRNRVYGLSVASGARGEANPLEGKDRRIVRKAVGWFAMLLILCGLWGCASGNGELISEPTVPVRSDIKIRVADVSNNTGKLFDVDVIGLLWSGLEDALKKRGMLASGSTIEPSLQIHAQVLEYKKGNAIARILLPMSGSTVLAVKAELRQGETVISTVESKRTISFGDKPLSRGMWKEIFTEVAEDVVNQLTRRT